MRYLAIFFTVLLTGCSSLTTLYDSYFLGRFDNQEYRYITEIRTGAEFAQLDCADEQTSRVNAKNLHRRAAEFYNYSRMLPNNKDATDMAHSFVELTTGLEERYTAGRVSTVYCRTKFDIIGKAAESAQRAIARKPR